MSPPVWRAQRPYVMAQQVTPPPQEFCLFNVLSEAFFLRNNLGHDDYRNSTTHLSVGKRAFDITAPWGRRRDLSIFFHMLFLLHQEENGFQYAQDTKTFRKSVSSDTDARYHTEGELHKVMD